MAIGIVGSAQADFLASAPTFGNVAQAFAGCSIFNTGNTTVSGLTVEIYPINSSVKLATISNNCSSLNARRGCSAVAQIKNNIAHSCRVAVASKVNLRGRLEIRDTNANLLASETLH
jgi:hypothetical protein